MNIDYDFDSSFILRNSDNNYLRWDFILNIDSKKLFIEYQGRQHYEYVCFGGISKEIAQQNFAKQQENDKLKDNFCYVSSYDYLKIKYTDFGNIPQLLTEFITKNTLWNG